ncbi:MAG: hypothetical protein HY890_00625 [Deltaproteobacteria bacterium]|nr:hypothetical protein [Deltaproteobacteria bacterium]
MRKSFLPALAAFAVFALVMYATPSGAVHKGSGPLTCGNCHTMHSSQGGTSSPAMGGATGSFLLLRGSITGDDRKNIHEFCLQCHAENGAQGGDAFPSAPGNTGTTRPPKVYLTTDKWANGDAFDKVGAGGDFSDVGGYSGTTWTANTADNASNNALGTGHSLGMANPIPPGNTTSGATVSTSDITRLTCTSCHDPHGTDSTTDNINKYRNLKAGDYLKNYLNSGAAGPENTWTNMSSGGFGDLAMGYAGGIAGSVTDGTDPNSASNRWPVWRSSGTQNYYYGGGTQGTMGTIVGISRFCAQCHGAWHEGLYSAYNVSGDDWKRHPVQNQLHESASRKSGGGITIVDDTHYWDDAIIPIGKKLPAAQNALNATSGTTYYANGGEDRVFCLSCHFAHGSPNNDILRWNYTSAVSTGSQIGVGVASDTGCQQCHNR